MGLDMGLEMGLEMGTGRCRIGRGAGGVHGEPGDHVGRRSVRWSSTGHVPRSGDASGNQGKVAPTVGASGPADRKLARSARLDLSTPKLDDAVSRARTIATGAGGYTGQENTLDDSASLTLAVPAEQLDGVLDQLAALGKVTEREVSAKDVTAQVVDVDARLATQRASVDRIRALLAKATSISEIASVESELTSREAALESLEQQQKSLAGSVAMATVALSVTEAPVSGPAQTSDDSKGFVAGLAGGWHALLAFGGGLLTVLGALAPFAVVLGVPAVALGWWWRRRRRLRVAEDAASVATAE
ncbi:MAG TPA: DUF4349 domain-containing protein [Amycolatopsis sp.]|nr:DUF4349 domain-containing protein [Amycolatopsis sp.]